MRKILWITLIIVVVIGIGVGIWYLYKVKVNKFEIVNTTSTKINVATLKDDKEKDLGTILYPGAGTITDITKSNAVKMVLETTDSVDGAVNIYVQDLSNRYRGYKLTKEQISKSDSLNKKAMQIILTGKTGTLKITIWPTAKGMTDIEINKDSNFQ